MMLKDYEIQFNIQPVGELEAYCKQEDVSLLFVRRPDNSKENLKIALRKRILKIVKHK